MINGIIVVMATSLNTGGYICEFLDSAKEEFHCHLCLHVAKDPHMTSCCGEHFCQTCLTPFLHQKQPCPKCSTEDFTSMLNVKYKQQILKLQVFCTQREKGCEWSGPLSTLSDHVNPSQGDCQFLENLCPNGCGQKITKNDLEAHLEGECFKRKYTCPYCSYKDTYEAVSNQHTQECPYIPVRCPNFCGVTCERDTIESHMKICPLEKVECEYAFAGCKETFLRDNEENHLESSHKQHLALLNKECARMKSQFEKKLKENAQEFAGFKAMTLKDQQAKQMQIDELTLTMKELTVMVKETFRYPQVIIMYDFNKHKENPHNRWLSEFYGTHPKGYKYQIFIHPNGVGEGAGTHLSVSFAPRMTINDDLLKWPAKCVITFQLVNQFHDQDHHTVTETLTWNRPTMSSIINLSRLFIKLEDMKWNAKKQTQYLNADNTVQFRITKVIVLSI